jgi:prepilin-type N-terminal cleavage/methylation domain-containing protein
MKLTQTPAIKRKSGMTLIELTVVIVVLLSLIAVLFIGARAWKKGADKAGCIMNIRNMQQAVRSYANLGNIAEGGTIVAADFEGPGKFLAVVPNCPSDPTKAYDVLTVVPTTGTLFATCTAADKAEHIPAGYTGW